MPKATADVIKVACPECGAGYKVPAAQDGKKLRCQKCGSVFRIGGDGAKAKTSGGKSSRKKKAAAAPAAPAKGSSKRAKAEAPAPSGRKKKGGKSGRGPAAPAPPAKGKSKRGKAAPPPKGKKKKSPVAPDGGPRRRPPRKKTNVGAMLGAGGVVLCIVIGAIHFLSGGGEDPAAEQAALEAVKEAEKTKEFKVADTAPPDDLFAEALKAAGGGAKKDAPKEEPKKDAPKEEPKKEAPKEEPKKEEPKQPEPPKPPAAKDPLAYKGPSSQIAKMEQIEEDLMSFRDPDKMDVGEQRRVEKAIRDLGKGSAVVPMLRVMRALEHNEAQAPLGNWISSLLTDLFQPPEDKLPNYPPFGGTDAQRKAAAMEWVELYKQGILK